MRSLPMPSRCAALFVRTRFCSWRNIERLDPNAVGCGPCAGQARPSRSPLRHTSFARLHGAACGHTRSISLGLPPSSSRVGRPEFEIGAVFYCISASSQSLIEAVGEVANARRCSSSSRKSVLRAGKETEHVARALPQRALEQALLQLIAHQRYGLQIAFDVDFAAAYRLSPRSQART